jgi:hypothetical protein
MTQLTLRTDRDNRTLDVEFAGWDGTTGMLVIENVERLKTKIKKTATIYRLTEFGSPMGRAFACERGPRGGEDQGECWHVLVNANGQDHTCCCPDQQYRGHQRPCRHLAAVLALLARGELDPVTTGSACPKCDGTGEFVLAGTGEVVPCDWCADCPF